MARTTEEPGSQAPDHPTALHALLDAIEEAQGAAYHSRERRRGERQALRRRLDLRYQADKDSPPRRHAILSRNLSRLGAAAVLGEPLESGQVCEVDIATVAGTTDTLVGNIVYCTHLQGQLYQIGLEWSQPIDLARFITAQLRGHILLVDDSSSFGKLAQHHLSRQGLRVSVVSSAPEALDRATAPNADYALILLDVQMPDLDGLSALRQLRERGVQIPIVMMSADNTPECRVACDEVGADGFLPKPLDRQELAEMVRLYVGDGAPQISDFAPDPGMQELIASFVRSLPERMQQLRSALTRARVRELLATTRELKTLAGGTVGCGFEELCEAARKLEQILISDSIDWKAASREVMRLRGLSSRAICGL